MLPAQLRQLLRGPWLRGTASFSAQQHQSCHMHRVSYRNPFGPPSAAAVACGDQRALCSPTTPLSVPTSVSSCDTVRRFPADWTARCTRRWSTPARRSASQCVSTAAPASGPTASWRVRCSRTGCLQSYHATGTSIVRCAHGRAFEARHTPCSSSSCPCSTSTGEIPSHAEGSGL